MTARARKVFVEDLLSSRIVTADGNMVGRVVDLELTRGAGYQVSALLTGPFGWLDRLHVIGPAARFLRRAPKPKSIPWADVESFEGFVVKLKAIRQ
jgi:sporulation protein YlmC with PRC-barrel domain